jgi:hypothetical protein
MPYYRITIFLKDKKKPVQGIRQYDQPNIDVVTNMAKLKAKAHYGEHNIADVEAVMLSSHSNAVMKFMQEQQKKKKDSL